MNRDYIIWSILLLAVATGFVLFQHNLSSGRIIEMLAGFTKGDTGAVTPGTIFPQFNAAPRQPLYAPAHAIQSTIEPAIGSPA